MRALTIIKDPKKNETINKDFYWQCNCLAGAGYDSDVLEGERNRPNNLHSGTFSFVLVQLNGDWKEGLETAGKMDCGKIVRFLPSPEMSDDVSLKVCVNAVRALQPQKVLCYSPGTKQYFENAGFDPRTLRVIPPYYDAGFYDYIKADIGVLNGLIDGKINIVSPIEPGDFAAVEILLAAVKCFVNLFGRKIRFVLLQNSALQNAKQDNYAEELIRKSRLGKYMFLVKNPSLSRRKAIYLAAHAALVLNGSDCAAAQILEPQYFKVPLILQGSLGNKTAGEGSLFFESISGEEAAASVYTLFNDLDSRLDLTSKGSVNYHSRLGQEKSETFIESLSGPI